ncbi:hypothetical protein Pan241w_01220 [Gimesia alba]|uniref:Uncharacterized protein n=1 Tax=Gimesia alba TaxID=2527973 RepID=A0A517R844_9PLAN|nr:hypothetical protein Pan241w_01220 [Gimesia alba]
MGLPLDFIVTVNTFSITVGQANSATQYQPIVAPNSVTQHCHSLRVISVFSLSLSAQIIFGPIPVFDLGHLPLFICGQVDHIG